MSNDDDDDKENRPLCPNFPKYPNHYEKCAAINSKLYLKWLANKIKQDPACDPGNGAKDFPAAQRCSTHTHVIIIIIC